MCITLSLRHTGPGEPRLSTLDGYILHINFKFLRYCENNDICVFCLPLHSTHLLQPLDIGLISPLQTHYQRTVEDYFLTTNVGISHGLFFLLYKMVCALIYTKKNIAKAFQKCGIIPFNPWTILGDLPKPS